MKLNIPALKAKLHSILKATVGGVRVVKHNGLEIDMIDSLLNQATDLKAGVEIVIIRQNPVNYIELQLINDIVNKSVIVSNKNYIFDDSQIQYHLNTPDITDKNIIRIPVDGMYFNIDYPVGEIFEIRYFYRDADYIDPLLPGTVITLKSLTHEIINNDNIVVTIEIENTSANAVDIAQFIELTGFSLPLYFVRTVPANDSIEIVYTYTKVPQGSYYFHLTGTVEGEIETIIINEKTSVLSPSAITKSALLPDNWRFSIDLTNSGAADASEKIIFRFKTMPEYIEYRWRATVVQTIIAGQTKTFASDSGLLPAGNYKAEAYLNNGTFLEDLDFTI